MENSGKKIFVIEDVPLTNGESAPDCVGNAGSKGDPCSVDRVRALGFDPVEDAVKSLNTPKVQLVDLTNQFCDQTKCHSVIGGLIVYRDSHHVSGTFALSLFKAISSQIKL